MNERQKQILWKTFDSSRWAYLRTERQRARKALQETVNPIIELMESQGLERAYNNFEVDKRPLLTMYERLYTNVGGAFGEKTYKELTGMKMKQDEDEWIRAVKNYLGIAVAERLDAVTATSRDYITRIMQKGISEGWSIQETAKQIKDKVGGVNRATRIARTEIISASNLGSIEGARATGLPLKKTWLATRDNRTRETHSSVDGQERGLDEAFDVGGYEMQFPGDWSMGADVGEVVNCRCAQIYRVDR